MAQSLQRQHPDVVKSEVFEERVGETCDDVTGYMGPAEVAVWRLLAELLKVSPEANMPRESAAMLGFVLSDLLRNWRDEIIARLDRDEIEARCERNARDAE